MQSFEIEYDSFALLSNKKCPFLRPLTNAELKIKSFKIKQAPGSYLEELWYLHTSLNIWLFVNITSFLSSNIYLNYQMIKLI